MTRYNTSIATSGAPISTISRRAYNLLAFGMVTLSFLVMWGTYLLAGGSAVNGIIANLGAVGTLGLLIGSLAGSIVGIVLMGQGKAKQKVGLSVAGYALFSLTFGFTIAMALQRYELGTIYYAFGITACLSGIFLVAGVVFPEFFARIGRVLVLSLLAVVLVELVATIFFHANQTIFDYIVVIIFCGLLGYDSYKLAADEPTVPNAVYNASQIYVDIANILIRVLDILDHR